MNKIKKSLIALLFIVASIFFVIPVYADTPYVEDDYGGLTSTEIEELDRLARKLIQTNMIVASTYV